MKLKIYKRQISTMHSIVKNYAFVFLLLMFGHSAWAQFSVAVTPSPETCEGTGSLSFTPTGVEPGATVNYKVYMPPSTTPIYNNSVPLAPGLQSGTYKVVATQMIGVTPFGTPFTVENIVITDEVEPLLFTVTPKAVNCGNDGELTVVMASGNPVNYQIITPPMTSPTGQFTGLAVGSYTVKVTDNCGASDSQVVTLTSSSPILSLGAAVFPDVQLPACNLLTATNFIASTNGIDIVYPIQVTVTVYPPGGAPPIVYNPTASSVDETNAIISQIIPYYYGQTYMYKVEITDPCGVKQVVTTPVNPVLTVNGGIKNIECGRKAIEVNPAKFVGPFTLQFIMAPPGFNPADYNDQYPGPYTVTVPTLDLPIDFGGEGNPLPWGNYQIKIVDACGRTATSDIIENEEPEIEATVNAIKASCITGLGMAKGSIPGLFVGGAVITQAPPEYPNPIPDDISDLLSDVPEENDEIEIPNLPPGIYKIILTDTCGVSYPEVEFEIKGFDGAKGGVNARVDCEPGFGTVKVSAGEDISHIEIISAPAAYTTPLPHDVSGYLVGGSLYMDHLPPGQYKFSASGVCDPVIDMTPVIFTVNGYAETVNDFTFTPHCGSFDLFFNHVSNGMIFVGFFLQKYDEASGYWSHPDTGVSYEEGTKVISEDNAVDDEVPNALPMENNTTTLSMVYPTGKYRIVKQYTAWGDGSLSIKDKFCVKELFTFEYFNELTIAGAVSLNCTGNEGDVQIQAVGVPPLTYKIITKNGDPFVIDNGENNTFSGLESAVYTVIVSDQCSTRPLTFNIADIPSLVSAPDPDDLADLEICDNDGNGTETFDISVYYAVILDDQDADNVTISYHASLAEAQAGTNALPDSYTTGTTTIHVRVEHISNPDCIALTSFNVIARPKPDLNMADTWSGCEGQTITITADSGFDDYTWSNGAKSESIVVSEAGPYTVTVKDEFGCEASKTVQAVTSSLPIIKEVIIDDWTDNSNVITVVMEQTPTLGYFEYSLDGITYQESPIFTDLPPGQYTIYVRDTFGCGGDDREVYILTYPKFFTPNGDGTNETWRIHLSALEPDMQIYIYDRYGKLITGFTPNSNGWDGTLNGKKLPSTDYWFVVIRQNGQELKGHFSMIR